MLQKYQSFIVEQKNQSSKQITLQEAHWILKHAKDWYVHWSFSESFPFNGRDLSKSTSFAQSSNTTQNLKNAFFLTPVFHPYYRGLIEELLFQGTIKNSHAGFLNRPYLHFLLLRDSKVLDLQKISQNEYEDIVIKLNSAGYETLWSDRPISDEHVFDAIERPQLYHSLKVRAKAHQLFGENLSSILNVLYQNLIDPHEDQFYTKHLLSKADYKINSAPVSRHQIMSRFLSKDDKKYLLNYLFAFLEKDKMLLSPIRQCIAFKSEALPNETQKIFVKYLNAVLPKDFIRVIDTTKTSNNLHELLKKQKILPVTEVSLDSYIDQYVKHKERIKRQQVTASYGLQLWARLLALSSNPDEWIHLVRDVLKYDLIVDIPEPQQNSVITDFYYDTVGSGKEESQWREKTLLMAADEPAQAICVNPGSAKKIVTYKANK